MSSNLIAHIKKYVSINEAETEALLSFCKHLSVKKKAYLLKEGQVCKSNYFVEQGCLRLFFINEKGTEQITQFAIENWWIADYMSLNTQASSQYFLQAVEASDIISINHIVKEKLFNRLPQLERYFRIMAEKGYAASQRRIKYLYDFSKEESYQHFINSYLFFAQRIPQYMLASFLNLTPEYLSELRKKFSEG